MQNKTFCKVLLLFKPKYLIKLKKDCFSDKSVACLGSQLIEFVDFLDQIIPPHVWYGADFDCCGNLQKVTEYTTGNFKKIGHSQPLKIIAKIVDQFLSGIILAIGENGTISQDVTVDTEDEEFRELDIQQVILEIRAFDTSYFEIYSTDLDLTKMIADKYGVEIRECARLG